MAEPSSTNRVGSSAGQRTTPSTGMQQTGGKQQPKFTSDVDTRLQGLNIAIGPVAISSVDIFDSFTTAQKRALAAQLKLMGKGNIKSGSDLRLVLESMSDVTGSYNSYNQLMSSLKSDYIGALDSQPNLPSRTIAQYDDKVIGKIVDNVWQDKVGALPTPEERAAQIAKVQGKFAEGTLTTTKKVYNKKTKQYENVTTSTPGYSQAQAQIDIENELKKSNPTGYNTKKALDFTDLITSTMRGGI